MVLQQFMMVGCDNVVVFFIVYCDYFIQAEEGVVQDFVKVNDVNKEVYDFLFFVFNKYGIGFWKLGVGIIY